MKLLICGGRDFNNPVKLDTVINQLPFTPIIIIEGGAPGADTLAREWAIKNGIHYAEVPALWDYYSKRAGPLRNTAMSLLKPDYCLAMPGGVGTNDMVSKCINDDITVWRPYG